MDLVYLAFPKKNRANNQAKLSRRSSNPNEPLKECFWSNMGRGLMVCNFFGILSKKLKPNRTCH